MQFPTTRSTNHSNTIAILSLLLLATTASAQFAAPSKEPVAASSKEPVRVIMLGDNGHHQPASLYRAIATPMANVGIEIEYSDDIQATLTPERLRSFDALLIYANTTTITDGQEKALLDYVEGGGGLVPLHCATYCFLNSEKYIALVGGQFKEHGGERFSTEIVAPEHEIMAGFGGFESWDETYIHHKHNPVNRIVLEERREGKLAAGSQSEPWTWVRMQGKGRVFYTAWGHNLDTWQQPGFHNLLERGVKWSAGRSLAGVKPFSDPKKFPIPKMTSIPDSLPKFTFTEVGDKIPNYTKSQKWGVQGAPITSMQNPVSPQESIEHYVAPESFEMKLWASEADATANDKKYAGLTGKPLAMNWDQRGRLWICETIDYPNDLQPPGQGRDRIRICEDSDQDGIADKFAVFASNLSIPTAIVISHGGAIVQDGPKTVFLKDINGDDVADFRQELITGWNLGDTHGGVSNFQFGLDNRIWAMQGYNDSTPVINGQKQQNFRQGFWRFAVERGISDDTAPVFAIENGKPSGSRTNRFDEHAIRVNQLEFMRSTNNNTWGLGISEEGLIFGSTANGTPSVFMPISNSYYERVNGWSPEVLASIADTNAFQPITPNVRQVDQHGGYTAGCGHALYTARKYPKSWWNRVAFVCEPTGHLVGTFILDRNGAGYRSNNPFNLVASDDEWAAPTMAEVGPDGNVWVLDWYNFIVQHNPTPQGFSTGKGNAYESDLRDKKYGRVYRLVYHGNEGLDKATHAAADQLVLRGLDANDEPGLVAALRHPTMLWRKHAQRLLVERKTLSQRTIQSLLTMVADPAVDSQGLNPGAIHALWVLNSTPGNASLSKSIAAAMKHQSPGVRRNAVLVGPNDSQTLTAILNSQLWNDSDLQVRLAALLKIADIADIADIESSVSSLSEVLARPDLLTRPGLLTDRDVGEGSTTDKWLLHAWTAAAAKHAQSVLPALLAQKEWDPNPSPEVVKHVGIVAQHAARTKLDAKRFEAMIVSPNNPDVAAAVIGGLVAGWPKEYEIAISKISGDRLLDLWLNGSLPIESKSQVLQLASFVGIKDLGPGLDKIQGQLASVFSDSAKDDASRISAGKQAIVLQPESQTLVAKLLAQVTAQSSPEFVSGMLQSLYPSRIQGMAVLLAERSRTMPPEFRKSAIRLLLNRPQTTLELIDSIETGKWTVSDLQLDQKQMLRDHPDESVRKRAVAMMTSSGGVPNSDRQKVLDAWMPTIEVLGNVTNGKVMYEKHCALCHQHGDIGVNIGPNLTGMAVHPKAELLMNIMDPSRSVEGNFRTYSVRTTDSVILTGMLASESKTSIELINSQGKKEVVLREDIDELIASQKSLMPEGFEGQMTPKEMSDLLEFLTSKGKYIPLPIDKIATSITTKGMFWQSSDDNVADRLLFNNWELKKFKGIPFVLVDPKGGTVPNAVMLYGPLGDFAPKMPKQIEFLCEASAVAIHLLSGVGGWSYPASERGTLSMTVRLYYANGKTEDHPLINGEHFADYIRRVDVDKSEFAFDLKGRQIRYLEIKPASREPLAKVELIKGTDRSAPVVMAITIQTTE